MHYIVTIANNPVLLTYLKVARKVILRVLIIRKRIFL